MTRAEGLAHRTSKPKLHPKPSTHTVSSLEGTYGLHMGRRGLYRVSYGVVEAFKRVLKG